MDKQEEKTREPQRDTTTSANDRGGEAAAREGQKAIEAGKLSGDEPESGSRKDDSKDAENWRNEG